MRRDRRCPGAKRPTLRLPYVRCQLCARRFLSSAETLQRTCETLLPTGTEIVGGASLTGLGLHGATEGI